MHDIRIDHPAYSPPDLFLIPVIDKTSLRAWYEVVGDSFSLEDRQLPYPEVDACNMEIDLMMLQQSTGIAIDPSSRGLYLSLPARKKEFGLGQSIVYDPKNNHISV